MRVIAAAALLSLCALVVSIAARPQGLRAKADHDYPVQPVPFTAVHLTDVFWAPRIETNRRVTIPFAFEQCELTGRVDNFERAAKALRGEPLTNTKAPGYPFDDTDLYKVIEGASYALSVHPDPKLDAYVDGLIAKIAAAQEPDGYLYTARTIDPKNPHQWSGAERWELEKVDSHELYDLGHLYEAAVAHYQATGKRSLLDVALKTADLLDAHVRPRQEGDLARTPDHRDGPREAVSRHRRTEISRPGEVHARRARPRRLGRRRARLQPVACCRPSIRAKRSATPCAPRTCIPAWPTSPR